MLSHSEFPFLGFGVGLRHCHFDTFLKKEYKEITWVEALTENYLPWEDGQKRRPLDTLEKIRKDLPVALHGVSLSIGSFDKLNTSYLNRLKSLCNLIEPSWISDHLCWTGVDGENMHDLLPLPYTEEALSLVTEKISAIQDFLQRPILIENVSSYVEFSSNEMSEWDFLSTVSKKTGCGILLDINNIFVSSVNHRFDPLEYLRNIPKERVGQIHVAGHTDRGNYLIDTHDSPVCQDVWKLYRWVCRNLPSVSAMIEWDDNIPPWPRLEKEVTTLKKIWEEERNAGKRKKQSAEYSATI